MNRPQRVDLIASAPVCVAVSGGLGLALRLVVHAHFISLDGPRAFEGYLGLGLSEHALGDAVGVVVDI